jgi:hypothetical protein
MLTKKRKLQCNREENLRQWVFLSKQFTHEADRTQAEIDNNLYQQLYFGITKEMLEEKGDYQEFHQWILRQIQEFSQMSANSCN